jgi:hypothetical protein
MFRGFCSSAAVCLPLLIVGCGEGSAEPSALPTDRPTLQTSTEPLATTQATQTRVQVRELTAEAFFAIDEECLETQMSLFVAERTFTVSHKPTQQPFAHVALLQFDACTGTVLHNLSGVTDQASFHADTKLASASVEMTLTAFDLSGPVPVHVDVTWSATAPLVHTSENFRTRYPGLLFHSSLTGTSRWGSATGTVTIGDESLAFGPSVDAWVRRVRGGQVEVVRTLRIR